MAPKKTNLKEIDEKLGTLASQIANHEFLILGVVALGDGPVPRLHKYFIASAPDSTKMNIQKKIASLLDVQEPKQVDRVLLIKTLKEEKENLLNKFEELSLIRGRMQNLICDMQVDAIKENAANMMRGAKKDYIRKMGVALGVCDHPNLKI